MLPKIRKRPLSGKICIRVSEQMKKDIIELKPQGLEYQKWIRLALDEILKKVRLSRINLD